MAKKTKKRIILTGAQGTGKTTLMNALAADGTKTLSIARETANRLGYDPSVGSSEEYQKQLFADLKKALSGKKNYISDRGLSCVAAYTFDGVLSERITKEIADNQYVETYQFHQDNPDALVVYLPIEFAIEDDGVRSTSVEDQEKIDFLIKNILDTAGIKYITATGSVEERVAQIEDALTKL